jgi:hypothetical protein
MSGDRFRSEDGKDERVFTDKQFWLEPMADLWMEEKWLDALKQSAADKSPMVPVSVPQGFQFIDISDLRSQKKFIGGLALNLGLGLLVFVLVTQLGGFHFVTLFFTVILAFSVLAFVQRTQLVARIEPGELTLSHHPLRLGESGKLEFCRRLRGNYQVQQGRVRATLMCLEIVHYRVGTDRRIVREIAWEQELTNQDLVPGSRQIAFSSTFQIPVDGFPSFEATNNQIRWVVGVWIDCPNLVKDDSTFTFTVSPEVLT